jgi:hypothetical protein
MGVLCIVTGVLLRGEFFPRLFSRTGLGAGSLFLGNIVFTLRPTNLPGCPGAALTYPHSPFSRQDLAQTISALSLLGAPPAVTFLDAFTAACIRALPAFTPMDIAAVLSSLAVLGYTPGPRELEALVTAVLSQLPGFGPSDLAKVGAGGGCRALLGVYRALLGSFWGWSMD